VSTNRLGSTRRHFLTALASAEMGLLSNRLMAQSDEFSTNILTGVRLQPFADPLPLPGVIRPVSMESGIQNYRITISEFRQKLHRDLPETIVWGFEGNTPGPAIRAKRGQPVVIDWLNRLPLQHRLLVDHTLDGAGKDVAEVRTTIHLHGGHVSSKNDGYPEDWITPGHRQRTYYPNRQPGAFLWYHDHAMGITRLNAMMGLAGIYILRDPEEDSLNLPSGHFDIPLTLQDRILDPWGQLVYPLGPAESPSVPEFFGSHNLVNGRVSPYLDVQPTLYRFRLLNASNARTFHLSLYPQQKFIQIGTDGGLLPAPVELNDLLISPGERVELLIDFRGREGRRLTLVNDAPAPYPAGGGPVPGLVLQFRVGRALREQGGGGRIPHSLAHLNRLKEADASKTRQLKLVEIMARDGQPHRVLLDGRRFSDPISEDPRNGSIEIWELVNTTMDAHPIHLHAVHFQILNRVRFDSARYQRTSEVVFQGEPLAPGLHEGGWKDTILCPPGQATRIIIPFSGEPGRYVWHCHMLEHEDNEMMRPYLLRA